MTNQQFIKKLKETEENLYVLNLRFGNQLNDGLEDRVDQVMNLLEKQRKSMETK